MSSPCLFPGAATACRLAVAMTIAASLCCIDSLMRTLGFSVAPPDWHAALEHARVLFLGGWVLFLWFGLFAVYVAPTHVCDDSDDLRDAVRDRRRFWLTGAGTAAMLVLLPWIAGGY